ncbi:MAG: rod shape-determining protein MreC [Muribaculaceae bacterium]|nr:rod shape-determining protein MreC [Muribaculaceae bacterium]MBR6488930.1 rod shape-determining protein MreC [Muribaculaceae bacterium]
MNNLINFFIKNSSWFFFAFYVILSLILLFRSNPFQQSVYLTSANGTVATISKTVNSTSDYFHLKEINEDLHLRNAEQKEEILRLQKQLNDLELKYGEKPGEAVSGNGDYSFISAHVISNSVANPSNYITIDRGSADGIEPYMGVMDMNGVVGIVDAVNTHSARIMSMLHPDTKITCELKGNGNFGLLVWDGKTTDHAILKDLPKVDEYHVGDTVVTSSSSLSFPPGFMVGVVERISPTTKSDNFMTLIVKLSCRITHLSNVHVIKNNMKEELKQLESTDATSLKEEGGFKR